MKRQHPDNPELFWCPKCGKYFPLTHEFWYWRNDNQKWRSTCKVCFQRIRHKYGATCINCGNKINATLNQIKKGKNIFCSHRCRTKEFISKVALNKMEATQFKKGERPAPNTEFKKGFTPWNKNKHGMMPTPWNATNTTITCASCGKKLNRKPYWANKALNNYCSRECSDKAKFNGGYPEQLRKRREDAKLLNDNYITKILSNSHTIPTPETIELKRQQIMAKRIIKEFKKWRKENDPTIADVPGIEFKNEEADECA